MKTVTMTYADKPEIDALKAEIAKVNKRVDDLIGLLFAPPPTAKEKARIAKLKKGKK